MHVDKNKIEIEETEGSSATKEYRKTRIKKYRQKASKKIIYDKSKELPIVPQNKKNKSIVSNELLLSEENENQMKIIANFIAQILNDRKLQNTTLQDMLKLGMGIRMTLESLGLMKKDATNTVLSREYSMNEIDNPLSSEIKNESKYIESLH